MLMKRLADYNAFSDDKLTKHNLFETERFFLDVYCLKPGQSQKPHAHPGSDKVYLVLDGSCRIQVDGEEAVVAAGTAVMAPAGSDHAVDNPGPADARLLVLMAPAPSK